MYTTVFLVALVASVAGSPIVARQNTTTSRIDPFAFLYPVIVLGILNSKYSQDLHNQLLFAPTTADRFNIIKEQGVPVKFDFNLDANPDGGVGCGGGGQGNLANHKTFPPLIGLGLAMSAGIMNPCGMNTPHIHPRATDSLTIV